MSEQHSATVSGQTSHGNDLALGYKMFARHQNRLWAMRSLWVVGAVVGASIVLPGQAGIWFALVIPAISLATMLGLRAVAKKRVLGSVS
jgi:hypothetical protein